MTTGAKYKFTSRRRCLRRAWRRRQDRPERDADLRVELISFEKAGAKPGSRKKMEPAKEGRRTEGRSRAESGRSQRRSKSFAITKTAAMGRRFFWPWNIR